MTCPVNDISCGKSCRKVKLAITGEKRAFLPGDSLSTAGERMRALHADAWPVVQDQTLVGMIDRPNPDWRAQRYGHDPAQSSVSGCMNCEVTYCYDDDDCTAALQFMMDRHFRHVPVVDHEMHFVGVVSLEEIIGALLGEGEVEVRGET